MMRSLFSGVAGLKSHQTRMDTVGNNIANVNTVGFKSSRTTFADTLYQTLSGASGPTGTQGGTNPKQIGLGTGVASIDTIFTDGSVQSTGKNTDLCLSGSGLFVVKNASGTYYTRDGAFEFDSQGNYVLPGSGLFVQGWNGTNGVVNTNAATTNVKVEAGKSMASKATTNTTYSNNLDSSAPTITGIVATKADGSTVTLDAVKIDGTYTAATLTMSDGTTQTISSKGDITYTKNHSLPVSTTLNVYDSLGNLHSVPVILEKDGTANEWSVNLASASIKESDGTTTNLTMTGITLKFNQDGSYNTGSGSLNLKYGNGASDQTVTVDLSKVTQYSGTSTIKAESDGNAAGTLKSVSVDSSGIITGVYTNGVKQTEAQVAIAQFTNPAGLTKNGSNLYVESNNSGKANVKTATSLGVTITPSALEMSNVDIANEFSDMIITQRGFQSNSKIITVGDEMLETLINMKR